MTDPISAVIPEITIHNDHAVTTSIAVANFFGKQHKHVLDKIRSLDCTPSFTTANFSAIVLTTRAGFDDREIEAFEMTKNGFIFLVMGFTGKKAAAFKEAYIAEFDRMESELARRPQPPAPVVPVFPVGKEFRYVTEIGANGAPVSMTILRNDQIVSSVAECVEILRRKGFVVIAWEVMSKLTTAETAQLWMDAKRQYLKNSPF
ncbi:Rha family transcriptional regulator [Enterobacter hormaechei]|uniref:Rha family transcriptional regulator n=1 Tax=Enterobacter hormaechei TaxID=158836 RepID=UPI0038B3B995